MDASTGLLKFPNPDKGQLQCTLAGKNLDKVNFIRLRNLKDPADAATVDGEVKLSVPGIYLSRIPLSPVHVRRISNCT
jgi:hypothetical protein